MLVTVSLIYSLLLLCSASFSYYTTLQSLSYWWTFGSLVSSSSSCYYIIMQQYNFGAYAFVDKCDFSFPRYAREWNCWVVKTRIPLMHNSLPVDLTCFSCYCHGNQLWESSQWLCTGIPACLCRLPPALDETRDTEEPCSEPTRVQQLSAGS